jgi:large subunit ribosomal protein L9
MKIILISTVANLGRIGDVMEVKSGYAKNFLIPSKKAICFTENSYKVFESKKQEFEQVNQDNLESAKKLQRSLLGKDIIIIKSASDDGRLYGSVTSSDIAAKVNELSGSKDISRSDIFLKKPIKEIGLYQVTVSPHSEVNCEVRLIVSRSESEISALLEAEKKANKKSEIKSETVIAESEESSEVEKPARNKSKKSASVE